MKTAMKISSLALALLAASIAVPASAEGWHGGYRNGVGVPIVEGLVLGAILSSAAQPAVAQTAPLCYVPSPGAIGYSAELPKTCAPAPLAYVPAPIYYAPPPVYYYAPPFFYGPREEHRHWH